MTKEMLLEKLKEELPPIMARKNLGRLTGGMLHPRTIANLDAENRGPSGKIRIGRKVGFTRDGILDWLDQNMELVDA